MKDFVLSILCEQAPTDVLTKIFRMAHCLRAKNEAYFLKYAPKESNPLCMYSLDSAPSETDDSHTILHGMPKKPPAGNDLFRRRPLSLSFFYACHIRKGTPGKRNLYLACYSVIILPVSRITQPVCLVNQRLTSMC